MQIEQLKCLNKQELVEFFIQPFRDSNYLYIKGIGDKTEAIRAVIKRLLDLFGEDKSTLLYGFRKDNELICASLSVDSAISLSVSKLIKRIFSLIRTSGLNSIVKEFKIIHKKPKYKERYLRVVLLGTLPVYQMQGFGRKMLHFLYKEAEKEKYKGVMILATHDTPAFRLYLKEGFIVEKEFQDRERTLCWMRRTS